MPILKINIVKYARGVVRKNKIGVNKVCKLFQISKKTFYGCVDPVDKFLDKYKDFKNYVLKIIEGNSAYGVGRIKIALKQEYNLIIGRDTLNKLLKLWGLNLGKNVKKSRINFIQKILIKLADKANLLIKRTINRPFQAISSDITEIKYQGGKAYLCLHKDVFGQMVYGFELALDMKKERVIKSLKQTIKIMKKYKIKNKIIFHQDQGSQYTSHDYIREVLKHGKLSYSRKGTPTENPGQESFFGRLKDENRHEFQECETFEDLKKLVTKKIKYYNNKRIHTSIKMNPKTFTKSFF